MIGPHDVTRGIRVRKLRLAGSSASGRSYAVSFLGEDDALRGLSVIAGGTQTGKTSIVDFIRYCLGGDKHPQHPEVLANVREAFLETSLDGVTTTIARSATGTESPMASMWAAASDQLADVEEERVPADSTTSPDSLSQRMLAACGMDNIALPLAPTQAESTTQLLSIRDLFRVMSLPNERLDSKNLVYEHSSHIVRQKFEQTVHVMFDVHDFEGADLAARAKTASDAAREAAGTAASLRRVVQEEHPLGPLVLETERERAEREVNELDGQLLALDEQQGLRNSDLSELRNALARAQAESRAAGVRVRNRRSLIDRLSALRTQYADDKKKLTFLKEAERLFDPFHVSVCPACLSTLATAPTVDGGACSLCGHHLPQPPGDAGEARPPESAAVLEAELRATSRRLDELNEYWTRLDRDLGQLKEAQETADLAAEEAAIALDRLVERPSPYLVIRDDLTRRQSDAKLRLQQTESGLRLWEKVRKADETAKRLADKAGSLRAERRANTRRPNRAALINKLSARFGEILGDIGYPKLSDPRLDDRLMPHVRGLPYQNASSGGLVLISLAWYLTIWEMAFEEGERGPGLLVIDSPQKNLGHGAHPDDPDFADTRLVENIYQHAKTWLAGPGRGAQLIVVDNSPPESVRGDVVVRFTRDRGNPPYGLIDNAVD